MKRFFTFKEILFLGIILSIASFLRFYNLFELMQFIPDQGWFYLSARDMLLTGNIPLVGPSTSHPWIHHGALWTYALAGLFYLFDFDPVVPAYYMALIGVATVILLYVCAREIFSERTAILASLLFTASPLIVMNSRLPYHTSPLPFFVLCLFYATHKWISGKTWAFPVITFMLGVLYNHEITSFVYFICIGIILIYGIYKRKIWTRKLSNKRVLTTSLITFLIPMTPFLLYDVSSGGYRQTLGFLVWVIYRMIKLPLSFVSSDFVSSGSNPSTITEFLGHLSYLFFAQSVLISIGIFVLSGIFIANFIYQTVSIMKRKKGGIANKFKFKYIGSSSYTLLFLFLFIGVLGLFVNRVPIEADTLLISPFLILLVALSLQWVLKNNFKLALSVVIVIFMLNSYFLLKTEYLTNMGKDSRITYAEKLQAVDKVIRLSNNKAHSIKGRGSLSTFPVFTMPYEYLLWWKGYPTKKTSNNQIIIWEDGSQVKVYKSDKSRNAIE